MFQIFVLLGRAQDFRELPENAIEDRVAVPVLGLSDDGPLGKQGVFDLRIHDFCV